MHGLLVMPSFKNQRELIQEPIYIYIYICFNYIFKFLIINYIYFIKNNQKLKVDSEVSVKRHVHNVSSHVTEAMSSSVLMQKM